MSVSCARASDAPAIGPADAGRRSLVGAGLAWMLGLGLVATGPAARAAGLPLALKPGAVRQALDELGGQPAAAQEVVLGVPDVAEDGTTVPVSVRCTLDDVTDIFIVVDRNPEPMVVRFAIGDGMEPQVATRIKMAASSDVHAWVRTRDRLLSVHRHTQVTQGGCG